MGTVDLRSKIRYYKRMALNPCCSRAYRENAQTLVTQLEGELQELEKENAPTC